MARTPILQSLKRRVADYRRAHAAGVPLHALREGDAAARSRAIVEGISRRTFLAGLGAATAAATLPSLAYARRDQPEIAIVGAGIAGLTCALNLADQGIAATVYEASGRIGGRMFSNRSGFWADGQVSEWCGELIDSGHKTIRHLARRFDLPLDDLLEAQPPGSEDTYYLAGAYYPKATADADFAAMVEALAADLDAAGYPTRFDAYTPQGQALDQMSVYDWIERRVPGGHGSPLGQLLDIAYAIEYGADTTDQSALNLLYLLGYQPEPKGLSIFGESDERFHMRGGNQRLPLAIAKHLGDNSMRLGWRLARISGTSGGRYRLSFEHDANVREVTADVVVLALPFAVLNGIDYAGAGFDARKVQAIQQLGRGRNGKLQLQFNHRVWAQKGPWPGVSNGSSYADTGFQSSWEVTRAQPGTAGIMNFYSGGVGIASMQTAQPFVRTPHPSVLADAQNVLQQAEPVFPGLSAQWNGKATQSLPHLSPFFGASYAYYRVGQYTTFGGYEGALQGGVYFCGEHTSMDFQGFMEGGAAEGKRVAGEIAKRVRGRAVSTG